MSISRKTKGISQSFYPICVEPHFQIARAVERSLASPWSLPTCGKILGFSRVFTDCFHIPLESSSVSCVISWIPS